jgi:hypothetical protein
MTEIYESMNWRLKQGHSQDHEGHEIHGHIHSLPSAWYDYAVAREWMCPTVAREWMCPMGLMTPMNNTM